MIHYAIFNKKTNGILYINMYRNNFKLVDKEDEYCYPYLFRTASRLEIIAAKRNDSYSCYTTPLQPFDPEDLEVRMVHAMTIPRAQE